MLVCAWTDRGIKNETHSKRVTFPQSKSKAGLVYPGQPPIQATFDNLLQSNLPTGDAQARLIRKRYSKVSVRVFKRRRLLKEEKIKQINAPDTDQQQIERSHWQGSHD